MVRVRVPLIPLNNTTTTHCSSNGKRPPLSRRCPSVVTRGCEFDSRTVLSRGAKPRDRSLTTQQVNKRPWCSGNPSACHAEDASSILAGRSAGWSSGLARQAHNLEVDGSNPSPATFSGRGKVWNSFFEKWRVVRNHEIVGSNPTVLTQHFHKHSGVAKR